MRRRCTNRWTSVKGLVGYIRLYAGEYDAYVRAAQPSSSSIPTKGQGKRAW